ncbi:MAG: low molecular weight phosphotyrosine protein phosphatase [Muribaculaceae bacterium]|nr:low molecular weight phosphotyrosine protein phosphatase [Muribaculaceae bacterium]
MTVNPQLQALFTSLREKPRKRVLFVCLGNICRSPAAEGVLLDVIAHEGAQDRWVVDSAGTGGWHIGELPDRRMRVHARNRGIELTHRTRQVRPSDFDDFDLIIPMDANNLRDLRSLAPSLEAARKIVPMATFIDPSMGYDHVPDPYYEGAEGFELVLDLLQNGCRTLFTQLSDPR